MENSMLIKSNQVVLHPISASIKTNISDEEFVCTKYYISRISNTMCDMQKNRFKRSNDELSKYIDDYKQYLYTPPLGLSNSILLNIYKISSINDINNLINNNTNLFKINRLLNCWLASNNEIIPIHKDIIIDIYIKLIQLLSSIDENIKNILNIKSFNIKNIITGYVNKSIDKKNYIDLLNLYKKKLYKNYIT